MSQTPERPKIYHNRRLTKRDDNQNFTVGECVPFYFCPRSIMLYILHMGNHPDISYQGGQDPIIHLQADLCTVANAARKASVPWVFSDVNASTCYATFYSELDMIGQLNWAAIQSRDFRDAEIKDRKQAEFLCYGRFPWKLIEAIGVRDGSMVAQVNEILKMTNHKPPVYIRREWYF